MLVLRWFFDGTRLAQLATDNQVTSGQRPTDRGEEAEDGHGGRVSGKVVDLRLGEVGQFTRSLERRQLDVGTVPQRVRLRQRDGQVGAAGALVREV